MVTSKNTIIYVIALITVAAFTITSCGLSYALEPTSKLRQVNTAQANGRADDIADELGMSENTAPGADAGTVGETSADANSTGGNKTTGLKRGRISINSIIEWFSKRYEHMPERNNVSIVFKPLENKDVVILDDSLEPIFSGLAVVIGEVLTNAMKYSKEGGKIEILLKRENGRIVLQVKDEGIGIPSDEMYKIFYEESRASNAPGDSLGSGLFLVKEIIEKTYHGEIKVESEENIGTTVTISFPEPKLENIAPVVDADLEGVILNPLGEMWLATGEVVKFAEFEVGKNGQRDPLIAGKVAELLANRFNGFNSLYSIMHSIKMSIVIGMLNNEVIASASYMPIGNAEFRIPLERGFRSVSKILAQYEKNTGVQYDKVAYGCNEAVDGRYEKRGIGAVLYAAAQKAARNEGFKCWIDAVPVNYGQRRLAGGMWKQISEPMVTSALDGRTPVAFYLMELTAPQSVVENITSGPEAGAVVTVTAGQAQTESLLIITDNALAEEEAEKLKLEKGITDEQIRCIYIPVEMPLGIMQEIGECKDKFDRVMWFVSDEAKSSIRLHLGEIEPEDIQNIDQIRSEIATFV